MGDLAEALSSLVVSGQANCSTPIPIASTSRDSLFGSARSSSWVSSSSSSGSPWVLNDRSLSPYSPRNGFPRQDMDASSRVSSSSSSGSPWVLNDQSLSPYSPRNGFPRQDMNASTSLTQSPPEVAGASSSTRSNFEFEIGLPYLGFYVRRSPMLEIFPEPMNVSSNQGTTFRIQARNIPPDIFVAAYMVEATVETPNGKEIPCEVTDLFHAHGIYEPNWFLGWFKPGEEVGKYTVRVRLLLPMSMWKTGNCGVIGAEATLFFVRNYYKASREGTGTSIQLEYVEFINRAGGRWNDSPGTSSKSKVWGIACDTFTNRLFYTDRVGNSLSCVDPEDGRVIFKYPSKPIEPGLNHPTGICVDYAHRRLIIADKDSHKVSFFSLDGEYISSFGKPGHGNGALEFPWDVAVSPAGDVIAVTDSRNRRLQLFDRNGVYINKFTVYEHRPFEYKHEFNYPRGVTFNREGTHVYVTDFNVHNIIEIPVDCLTYRKILPDVPGPGSIIRPQGITMDSDGCLLACGNGSVLQICPDNGHTLSWVSAIGQENLKGPQNVAVMGGSRVAVLHGDAKIAIF